MVTDENGCARGPVFIEPAATVGEDQSLATGSRGRADAVDYGPYTPAFVVMGPGA
ncbi:hypothetical protein D3C73_1318530 [compost metagenome]